MGKNKRIYVCLRKSKYKTAVAADLTIRRKERKGQVKRGTLSFYICDVCGYYHLTSHPRKRKKPLGHLQGAV